MSTDLENVLQERAKDWLCYLVVEEAADRGWRASFVTDESLAPVALRAIRLGVEGASSREEALKWLADIEEYERTHGRT